MANAVKKVIPLTFIYVTIVVFFINYILLEYLKFIDMPNFFLYIIYSIIFYFLYGYMVSVYASKSECNKFKKAYSTLQGLKSIILPIVVYLFIYFVPQVRQPFNELFGNNVLGNSIAEIVLISLNLSIVTIMNYFDSMKTACEISSDELEIKMKKLDKYLDKKPRKKKVRMIKVKD